VSHPDFHDLVGDDVAAGERRRLRRVHDLLVAAGPPPALTPALARSPRVGGEVRDLHVPRRRAAELLVAAALVAAAVAAGYALHAGSSGFKTKFVARMHGTALAPGALASIRVGSPDASGNWPMIVNVTGLKDLPKGGIYYLYLSKHGKPIAPCGGFVVHDGSATFRLSAGYRLKAFTGWIVTRRLPGQKKPSEAALLTTSAA
jgi:hypothetical protein